MLPVELTILVVHSINEFTALAGLIEAYPTVRTIFDDSFESILQSVFATQPPVLNELVWAATALRVEAVDWEEVLSRLHRASFNNRPFTLEDIRCNESAELARSTAYMMVRLGSSAQQITCACLSSLLETVEQGIEEHKEEVPKFKESWDPRISSTEYIRTNRVLLYSALWSHLGAVVSVKAPHSADSMTDSTLHHEHLMSFPFDDMGLLSITLEDLGLSTDCMHQTIPLPGRFILHKYGSPQTIRPMPALIARNINWYSNSNQRSSMLLWAQSAEVNGTSTHEAVAFLPVETKPGS